MRRGLLFGRLLGLGLFLGGGNRLPNGDDERRTAMAASDLLAAYRVGHLKYGAASQVRTNDDDEPCHRVPVAVARLYPCALFHRIVAARA